LFTQFKGLPLLWPSLAWVCGLVLGQLEYLNTIWLIALVLPLLVLRKLWFFFLVAGIIFATYTLGLHQRDLVVDSSWLGQRINIQGRVESVHQTPQYQRFRLSNIQREDGQTLSAIIDVYVYRQQRNIKPTMQVQLTVKLHQPHNKINPSYFDYKKLLLHQNVAAVGSAKGSVQVLDDSVSWLEQGRQKIRLALESIEQNSQGILLALLLADRSKVPLDIDDAFAASGATHLLAISGLHMGLVAAWGFLLTWWMLTRREAWIIGFRVRLMALGGGMLLAFSYATLAGWPIPAQRAFLMLLAGVLAWGMRASQRPLNTMFAALILITLFDSFSVLSVSLWLSFSATMTLLIWATHTQKSSTVYGKGWRMFTSMIWVSLLASLATLPLIGFVFERLPALGLLANALLVPLYAIVVLPFALLGELFSLIGLPSIASSLLEVAGYGIVWGNHVLLYLQSLPWGNLWLRSDMPWLFVGLAISLLIAGGFWLKYQGLYASGLLVLSLCIYAWLGLSEAKVKQPVFYVWDVGQGASSFLALPHFNLVIDAPGKQGSKFNGGTVAAQNIRKLGLLHVDAVVLSHAQSDHAGGVNRLLANLNEVHEIWLADVPENHSYFKNIIQSKHVLWLKRGDSFDVEGGHVQVLWPPEGYAPPNSNNASLVLLITLNTGQKLLLAGDLEAEAESAILGDLSAVDVMLMPHHGSKTSSTKGLVQKLRPKMVVAQTGYKNHYGFPKDEVVQRYHDVNSQVFNTANGYVVISFSPDGNSTLHQ